MFVRDVGMTSCLFFWSFLVDTASGESRPAKFKNMNRGDKKLEGQVRVSVTLVQSIHINNTWDQHIWHSFSLAQDFEQSCRHETVAELFADHKACVQRLSAFDAETQKVNSNLKEKTEERENIMSKKGAEFVRRLFKHPKSAIPRFRKAKIPVKGYFIDKNAKLPKPVVRCKDRFPGNYGEQVRCLIEAGHLIVSFRYILACLTKSLEGFRSVLKSGTSVRQTVILLQFARAYLADLHAKLIPNERPAVIGFYNDFLQTAGRLQIFNPQLELLLYFATSRLKVLDQKHADHFIVQLSVPAQGPLLMSTLNPRRDSHFSYDMHTKGGWEPGSTALLYEIEKYQKVIRKNDKMVLIDVGANLGWFSLIGAKLGCKVVALEPVPDHAQRLRESVALNGYESVMHVKEVIVTTRTRETLQINSFAIGPGPTAFVSTSKKERAYEHFKGNNLHLRMEEESRGAWERLSHAEQQKWYKYAKKWEEVHDTENIGVTEDSGIIIPAASVDLVVDSMVDAHLFNEEDIGIVKIDCEGCEFDALLSARKTLLNMQNPPDLLIEVCPALFRRCRTSLEDEEEVWELLFKDLHYNVYIYFHERTPPAQFQKVPFHLTVFSKRTLMLHRVPKNFRYISMWIREEKNRPEPVCFQIWATRRKEGELLSQSMRDVEEL